jgi:membrane-bound serine protease (ClpP class)
MLWSGGNGTVVAQSNNPTVCVIAVREDISHNTLFLVRRALREAGDARAAAVILDMETNGGRVDVTERIIRLLEHLKIPTATYVNPKAYSAGAFIACATDRIYMASGSVIGAATPVMLVPGSAPQELPVAYQEKISSAMRALIRATAQEKGHNPDVFEAMVDADKEVKIGEVVISEKGKLLTLTHEEAARVYGEPGKPLLSSGTKTGLDDVLTDMGFRGAGILRVEPFGFELLGRWITMISPLLVLVGFAAIYIEFKTPGIGLPALVAVICFSIYFLGFFAAGLAGWEAVVLFVLGFALLIVEVFVLPGFGVTGGAGIICILAGLVLAMTERWPGGPTLPSWPDLQVPIFKVVGLGFGGSLLVALLLGRFLPQTSLFRRMELSAATSAEQGYTASTGEARALVGAVGVAETMLRPAGKGKFGDRIVDVVTEGDLIERGAVIRVMEVHGSRVVVKREG